MLIRGGIEPFGAEVLAFAQQVGLRVADWHESVEDASGVVAALQATEGAALINLRRFLPDPVIAEINAAATAVLANSGHEPFGLVGLEAMASGVPVIGSRFDGGREALQSGALGRLVDPANPADIRTAVADTLADGARLIPAGLEFFSFTNFERRVHAILEGLR